MARLAALLVCLTLLAAAPEPRALAGGDDWDRLRREMVAEQIAARGIKDPAVLGAMGRVPRHLFVPPAWRPLAYSDRPLPIGQGQTISQPLVVAFMTEALNIRPGDKVLEIGTGSGYQAAVLAEITGRVYSVEIVPELAREAGARLDGLGYKVAVKQGDGHLGWPDQAPFDAIIGTAAAGKVPSALLEQLAPGGRMIIPVGPAGSVQELTLITRDSQGRLTTERLLDVRFVPMTGGQGEPPAAAPK